MALKGHGQKDDQESSAHYDVAVGLHRVEGTYMIFAGST